MCPWRTGVQKLRSCLYGRSRFRLQQHVIVTLRDANQASLQALHFMRFTFQRQPFRFNQAQLPFQAIAIHQRRRECQGWGNRL